MKDTVLGVFSGYRQLAPGDEEAGGLLLGTVHGQHLAIAEVTKPTRFDQRSRFFFERSPMVHRAIAQAHWMRSGGRIRYLGEWHTHPEDIPSPSGTDRSEWAALAAKRTDGRRPLVIVVGRKGLHVELVGTDGTGDVLQPIRE